MMRHGNKIIIDSGSTSSSWFVLNPAGQKIISFENVGLNPLFSGTLSEDLSRIIKQYHLETMDIKGIYFYGSGCKGNSAAKKLKGEFSKYLPNVADYFIHSDLEGARLAINAVGNHFVAILGTGSSVIRADEDKIIEYYSSGGYAIGEEGSGFHIGKIIIQSYLRNILSESSQKRIEQAFDISKDELITSIYTDSKINTYVAQYAQALDLLQEGERKKVLDRVFTDYCRDYLLTIPEIKKYPINFIGSIAFHFQKELNITLNSFSLQLGKCIGKPIDAIVDYHMKNDV